MTISVHSVVVVVVVVEVSGTKLVPKRHLELKSFSVIPASSKNCEILILNMWGEDEPNLNPLSAKH